ncbi:ATP-binding protein [Plebeiibacterium marinum]|uniref:histidine kinase n=1 Tax=Plebeiibacterium marinum TaxID=2992111 RepID=A0AAE3SK89_9BACT|nr:ATP-binding protein [Plebeiobacterium marinum]MCW3805210.1 ATP-binding protein [Plebeiobacterium marinum]
MKFSNKLLIWFSVFAISIATLSGWIGWMYFSTKGETLRLSGDVHTTYFNLLKLKNITNDFLLLETHNTTFYIKEKSPYLVESNRQNILLHNDIEELIIKYRHSEFICNSLHQINNMLTQRDSIFKSLYALVVERGYKDFGLVGKMREYAHLLEDDNIIDKTGLLSLRRREKDYIIRHEQQYVTKYVHIFNRLRANLYNNKTIEHLDAYSKTFHKVVQLDIMMGLHDNSGLKGELNKMDHLLEERMTKVLGIAKLHSDKKIADLRKTMVFVIAFTMLLCFFIANLLSSGITKPLTRLTHLIDKIILTDFKAMPKLNKISGSREISILYREFGQMIELLKGHEKERSKLIVRLTDNEKKYREMADKLPQGLFETDRRGVLVYVNKMWEKNFGYSKAEAEFQLNIFELTNKNSNHKNAARQNEVIALRKDKSWFPGLLYMDKVEEDGQHKGWRGVLIDISERYEYNKLLKEERRKANESDRLKTAFLANISHEIRTPLNAILGFSTLLKNKNFTENEKQEYYKVIEKSSHDLLSSFDDIISVSRMETDNYKLKMQALNLNAFSNEIVELVSDKAIGKGKDKVSIDYRESNENPVSEVIIDKERVKEVIMRLCENAIKFTHSGMIEIGHTLLKTKIIFFVKDSGIGIPEDKHKIIFDPFRQVDETNTKTTGGTGLGLAICKSLVNQMNGTIWVESMPGKGSAFYFSIDYSVPDSQGDNAVVVPRQSTVRQS